MNYDTAPGTGGAIDTNTGKMADTGQAAGTNSGSGGAYSVYNAPNVTNSPTYTAPSQTQNAGSVNTQLSSPQNGVKFPNPPADTTASAASSLASIPSLDNILAGYVDQNTPADQANTGIVSSLKSVLGRIRGAGGVAGANGQIDTSSAVLGAQDKASQALGYKNYADVKTQLAGLNVQIQQLQKEAQIIPLQAQQDATGRGITSAGLQPITDAQVRQNAIKALTLSSMAQTLQGNISNAEAMAQRAVDQEFAPLKAELAYDQQLYDMNKDTLARQDTKKAAALSANLAERNRLLGIQEDNRKAGYAAANAAVANYPGNQRVQLAAQQANALNPADPNYLQNLSSILGQYQRDPVAFATSVANMQKAQYEAKLAGYGVGVGGTQGQIPTVLEPYLKNAYDGTQYVDVSSLTPSERKAYVQLANQSGLKVVFDAATAEKVNAIAVSKQNLQNISDSIQGLLGQKDLPFMQGISNSIAGFFGNEQIKAFNSWRTAIINNVQALAGGQGSGLRINEAEIRAAMNNDLPVLTGPNADTPQSAAQKLVNLNKQLDAWNKQILGTQNTGADNAEPAGHDKGAVWIRQDGTYVSDGTQWVKQK